MPYLECAWVYIYCSKICDFRSFSKPWRHLDYNEQFPLSHHFTKDGSGKYQAVIFQELMEKKSDVLVN